MGNCERMREKERGEEVNESRKEHVDIEKIREIGDIVRVRRRRRGDGSEISCYDNWKWEIREGEEGQSIGVTLNRERREGKEMKDE